MGRVAPRDVLARAAEPGGLLPAGRHLLVACSGGRDSMALCHALHALGRWPLTVATVDHGGRPTSADDAAFVVATAGGWGLAVESLCVPPGALAAEGAAAGGAEGPEDAARRLRHRLLEAARERVGAERIVLAHTADDQWETLMMRLAAGAGAQGLSGMAAATGRRVRPWLEVRRSSVAEYARAHGVPWREDPTNADPRYLRNRVRRGLRPAFDAVFGASGVGGAARSAGILRAESETLEGLVAALRSQWVTDEGVLPNGQVRLRLDPDVARTAAPGLRIVMVHRLLLGLYTRADRPPPRRMAERVERICAALAAGKGRGVGGRDGFALVQGRGRVELTLDRGAGHPDSPEMQETEAPRPTCHNQGRD